MSGPRSRVANPKGETEVNRLMALLAAFAFVNAFASISTVAEARARKVTPRPAPTPLGRLRLGYWTMDDSCKFITHARPFKAVGQ